MVKPKSQRNREERERRIAKHGMQWERERKARSGAYIPVDQLSPRELKRQRKRSNARLRKHRESKKKGEEPRPDTQVIL